MATGGVNLSGEFFELLKAIGESKSKQEEDRIMAKEIQVLKQKLEHATTALNTKKKNKEFMVRLLYVEMLGHDGSFGYMKAVECAAMSGAVAHKRTGYLVCACCLPPDHAFRFMLVNQMQRDVQSTHVLECCGGLLACSAILTSDMVPAVAPHVTTALSHEHATVRKKAIVCLHRLYTLAPDEAVSDTAMMEHVRKLLCDKDPSVMGACLPVIYQLVLSSSSSHNLSLWKDLVPSLVSILKQIGERRLPSEYDYHRTPAPWMQLLLLRIMGVLGKGDPTTSSGMYEIIGSTLQAADTGINAGYAIVYECVKTIVSIYPHATLLDTAAQAIARFMDARSHNLKYLGVTGLAWIVAQSPAYAAQHQLAVMDCLEDPDETLQRKTLDLLYRMTNPVNVEFIVEKLVEFLQRTPDVALQQQLTVRVCDVAERYAPHNVWYIKTVTQVLQVVGDLVDPSVAATVLNLLAEGTGEDSEEADMLLRQTAVELYVDIILCIDSGTSDPPPQLLLETMAWCLGEYGYLSAVVDLDTLTRQLVALPLTTNAPTTQRSVLSAVAKLVAQAGQVSPVVAEWIATTTVQSADVQVQQRSLELQQLFLPHNAHILPEVFPVDASAEDVVIDTSAWNGIVQQALQNGARPYDASLYDADDDDDDDALYGAAPLENGGFKMTPYETPSAAQPSSATMAPRIAGRPGVPLPPGASDGATTATHQPATTAAATNELQLNTTNVANVWGKGGLKPAAPAPPAASWGAAPAPNPAAAAAWGAAPPPAAPASNNSGAWGAAAAPAAPAKTAAQLERERQAAALFGGLTTTPPVSGGISVPAAPAPAAPVPAPAPPPPAPVVDLLDLGGWDDAPAAAPTPAVDNFAPAGDTAVVVETVSDDNDVDVASPPPAAPAEPQLDLDPFASAGLLGEDQPLQPLAPSAPTTFSHKGTAMVPWTTITTPEFGQQWTALTGSSPPVTVTLPNTTLADATARLQKAGVHVVQIIGTEAITAAKIGASIIVLLHAAAQGNAVAVSIQCSDPSVATALAVYLPTVRA